MDYKNVIEELKERVDILTLIGEYVNLKKVSSSNYTGLCPFHIEKTPSFSVNVRGSYYHCFGCKKGGDVINFLMEIEKIDFQEAINKLAQRVGLKIDFNKLEKNEKFESEVKALKSLLDLNKRLVKTFSSFFEKNVRVKDYILKERLISLAVVNTFQLGYLPSPEQFNLYEFLIKKSYSREFLKKTGLFSSKRENYSIFSSRVIFPIKDFKGNVVAFGGRILEGTSFKYINLAETIAFKKKETLYGFYEGLDFIREKKQVILCEGYLDVLSFHSAQIKFAVATLGTAFTKEHAALINRYVSELILCFDGDSAGLQATLNAFKICLSVGMNSSIIEMEADEDPSLILKKYGEEALKNRLKEKRDVFDYLLVKFSKIYNIKTQNGLKNFLKQLFPLILAVEMESTKEVFLERIAKFSSLSLSSLKRDFLNAKREGEGSKIKIKQDFINYDKFLIISILQNIKFFAIIRRNVVDSDIEDFISKKIFLCVEELYERGENFSVIDLKRELLKKHNISEELFSNFLRESEKVEITEEVLVDIVLSIKKRVLLKKRDKLIEESKGNKDLIQTAVEIKFLNNILKNLKVYVNEKR